MSGQMFEDWEGDTLPGRQGPASTRVLVVDDDREMRQLVKAQLKRDGFEVAEAKSGEAMMETLETLELESWPRRGVELFIVHLRMPGIDGLETLSRLRAEKWDTPALLMTAFPDDDVCRRANELGIPVLAKPFSLDELSRAVANLLILEQLGGIAELT